MTTTVGMRELVRNSNILEGYDYVEVEDKISKAKQEKIDRIMKYAGKGKIDEKFNGLASSQIKEKIALEKYGK